MLLNASIVAGGITMLQILSSSRMAILVITIFLGGAAMAIAGIRVLQLNKKYYRALVVKKTLIEASLGFTEPLPGFESYEHGSLSTGPMSTRSKVAKIIRDPDAYVSGRIRLWTATDWSRWVLLGFAAFDLFAGALVFWGIVT